MSRVVFFGKTADESHNEVFNFSTLLAAGETIASATVTAPVYSGEGSLTINGSATISGAQVTQRVSGGSTGSTYMLTCTALTSLSQTLVLAGFYPILPVSS